MAFPSTLSTFNRPATTDKLNSPSHSALHNTVSSALGQVEAVIGVDGTSSVVGTMMYDLRSPASGGGGHVQWVNKGGTGQTSYTKGDILVAQSSSVLTKLAIGTDGYLLNASSGQATGVQWVAPTSSALGISNPTMRVVTAVSSVWSKPTGLAYAVVEVVGGGGGASDSTTNISGASGGGAGYARKLIVSSLLGSTENIVVGAGGAGGNGASSPTGDGVTGGTTGFGTTSILYATGGGGAVFESSGGTGGTGVLGDVNLVGNGGSAYSGGTGKTGSAGGGSAVFGGGGIGAVSGTGGNGSNGGGGGSGYNTGNGGAGGTGVCVIAEYYI